MKRLQTAIVGLALLAAIPVVSLADATHVAPQESAPPGDPWKPPAEAELAELARADTASPAIAASPGAPDASKADGSITDRLLRVAHGMLSVPYRFGGTTLRGLDCSGFVQKTFAFFNLDLPRSAREQFREGAEVAKADLSPGDLVFFRTYAIYPSHVGIYLGDDRFIHASSRDRRITVDSLDTPYYMERYIGAKRLLFEQNDIEN
jgi:cell wall-associated NlpC family hydrolase